MTWLAQAMHVGRKDLRLTKWSLLLYAAGVTLLTGLALLGVAIWGQLLWAGALCVAGGLLLGMFVHADSPTSVDAFWATRPLSTSAVYAAKVVGALVLLAVPLIAELVVLLAHGIDAARALTLLVRPAAAYAALLATALMVAVLTPNLRLFVIAFIVLFLAELMAAQLLPWFLGNETGPLPVPALYTLSVGGMIALGAWQYYTRSPYRGIVFGFLMVVMLLMIPARMLADERRFYQSGTVAVDTVPLHLEVQQLRQAGRAWRMPLRLTMPDAGTDRYYDVYIHDVMARIGGELVELPKPPAYLQDPRATRDGIKWLNSQPNGATMSIDLSTDMRERLQQNGATIVVHVGVNMHAVESLVDLPATGEGRVVHEGQRLRIASIERTPQLEIAVRHSMVPPANDEPINRGERYELVNEARGEAVALTAVFEQEDKLALVLPASHGRMRNVVLNVARTPTGSRAFEPDDEWLAQARLRYVRLLGEGHYTVSAEAPLPRN